MNPQRTIVQKDKTLTELDDLTDHAEQTLDIIGTLEAGLKSLKAIISALNKK